MTIYFAPNKTHLKPLSISEAEAKGKTLMKMLLEAHLPVASSCQGDGICSKCRIRVLKGHENLSQELPLELKTKTRNKMDTAERLACQIHVSGDITIDTDYW